MQQTQVTGLILAGGRARRMGGEDKGLLLLHGQPLIEHVITAFSPQVNTLYISANRNISRYIGYGYTVLEDAAGEFQGPLAGLQRALRICCPKSLIAVVPCDAPRLPPQLVARLLERYHTDTPLAVIPHDGQRLQPLFGLFAPLAFDSLNTYLASGRRKVADWVKLLDPQSVDFSGQTDAFLNINSHQDLMQAKQSLPHVN
jgi:molybdopterin-guanine dinucleotide biosynthesis protein A